MSINNFNRNTRFIESTADRNYNSYTKTFSSLQELGKNENMLTNIEHMKQKLNTLLEEGKIKNDDMEFTHLNSIIDGAMRIQIKSGKSLNDISEFYTAYNNFNDVYKFYSGDQNG